jgi:hypothetical protein
MASMIRDEDEEPRRDSAARVQCQCDDCIDGCDNFTDRGEEDCYECQQGTHKISRG